MKREELDRLAELLARATPGPWDVAVDSDYGSPPRVYRGRNGGFCVLDADHERAIADARLIVRLRNAAPALIDAAREAEELRKMLERIERHPENVTDPDTLISRDLRELLARVKP